MNTRTEPDHRINPYLKWLIYLGFACFGLGLFIACGITGGFLMLNWLI